MKTGYFFKNAFINDDKPISYKNEKLYSTPEELVEAILEKAKEEHYESLCEQRDESNEHITPEVDEEEYDSIKEDIMSQVNHCKDALSVCYAIKELLLDYEETCDLFLDIGFTTVF